MDAMTTTAATTPTAPAAKQPRIEAYGVKGLASRSWRKTFKSTHAMMTWAMKHDATILATRDEEQSR